MMRSMMLLLMCWAGSVAAGVVATDFVTYETFGAVGDGAADDLPAIQAAHERANELGLPVRSNPDATYHLGRRALTVVISTDTDWSTSRFIVDDTDVENHKRSIFEIRSRLEPVALEITRLKRDQRELEVRPATDCFVTVENKHRRRYIRRGLNRNSGSVQRDGFILRADGSIDSPIDWDYDVVTKVTALPMDERVLVLRGGVFTTIANRMPAPDGYSAWARNIKVLRSNTEITGLTHHVTGETDVGCPYGGFIAVSDCANVTLRDCFATGHKTYKTIGSAGKPVSMGSYDYSMKNVVNLKLVGCRMDDIHDRSLWGVIGTSFCKNIVLEDCVLSRMDVHQGVSGEYVIRDCVLGHMGLSAIGRGRLVVEGTTIHSRAFVNFRSDYGSTWQGDVLIRNCRWIPGGANRGNVYLFGMRNDGEHDFGYPCFMPREVVIENLVVENAGLKVDGMFYFADPGAGSKRLPEERPHPYAIAESITVTGLEVADGRRFEVSPNEVLRKRIRVKEK